MTPLSKEKQTRVVLFGGFALMILAVILYRTLGISLITSIYNETAPGTLNGLISNRDNPLSAYLATSRVYLSQLILYMLFAQIGLLAVVCWGTTKEVFRRFFFDPVHPLNLAIFRIVLFATMIKFVNIGRFVELAKPGAEFIQLPHNLFWLEGHVPINATLIFVLSLTVKIAAFTAMIGFFTRVSTAVVAVLSLYVLCLPIMFGKLEHHHHFVLLSFLMATSRCGDYLSVDALIRAWRRGKEAVLPAFKPDRAYGPVVAFIYLTIGISYFSAGYWKWMQGGWDWAFTEHLQILMHKQWMLGDQVVPLLRIDRYPLLYMPAAVFTIVWETGFVFAMPWRRARIIGAWLGLFFHVMLIFYMKIFFWFIMTLYVIFVDWFRILQKTGGRLFKKPCAIRYDQTRVAARRWMGILRSIDLLNLVEYEPTAGETLTVTVGEKTFSGAKAAIEIAKRNPLAWLLLPALASLSKSSGKSESKPVASATTTLRLGRAVWIVGLIIFSGQLIEGLRKHKECWPFACYPTFAVVIGDRHFINSDFFLVKPDGEEVLYDTTRLVKYFHNGFQVGQVKRRVALTKDIDDLEQQTAKLLELIKDSQPGIKDYSAVRFYRVLLDTNPDNWDNNPVERTLIKEFGL